jgi:hypothetical protein
MFEGLVESAEEQAFPHITVPLSHENGILENTGYVRQLAVADADDGEQLLMAGIEFTDPSVKDKVLNGSIADTSVGIKFNYRNKRSGKTYPYALEHVALTQQPWIDGLPGFGAQFSQPFDQEASDELEKQYTGVFAHPEDIRKKQSRKRRRSSSRKPQSRQQRAAQLSQAKPRRQSSMDILPDGSPSGGMRSTMRTNSNQQQRQRQRTQRQAPTQGRSAEQLFAAQQARQEQLESQLAEERSRREELELSVGTQARSAAETAHRARVQELQTAGHIPALVQRYEEIGFAQIEADYGDGDGSTLTLSITPTGAEEPEDVEMSPLEVADYLLSAVPPFGSLAPTDLAAQVEEFNASAKPSEKSAAEKADEIERQSHPERFGDDGKRLPPDQIEAAPGV